MSAVVFLRGVNVGGQKTFQPSVVARNLAHLSVVNVGAAGTLVVCAEAAPKTIRRDLRRALPFEPEMMIVRGSDVLELVAREPFPKSIEFRRFVSVMSKPCPRPPPLPIRQPAGDRWEVKTIGVSGLFAFSLWRRLGKSFVDPTAVVEKALGVRATTRNWNTIVRVCRVLGECGAA